MSNERITIRLTTEQQDQLRRLTGREGAMLVLPVDHISDYLADEAELRPGEFEDLVWECLNP